MKYLNGSSDFNFMVSDIDFIVHRITSMDWKLENTANQRAYKQAKYESE